MELDKSQIPNDQESDHQIETLKVTFNTEGIHKRKVEQTSEDSTENKAVNCELRPDTANPKSLVSPWFSSTLEPDNNEITPEEFLLKEKAFEVLKQHRDSLAKLNNNTWTEVGSNITDVITVETISFVKGDGSEEESMSDDEESDSDDESQSELLSKPVTKPVFKFFEYNDFSDEGKHVIKLMAGIAAVYAIIVPSILLYNR